MCEALGYPVPTSFGRKRPRFPGQQLDIYVQKSNNLQVWNEQLEAIRRYALVRVCEGSIIVRVKVVTGDTLAKLDTTGTLTQKYQRAWCGMAQSAVEVAEYPRSGPRPRKSPRAFGKALRRHLGNLLRFENRIDRKSKSILRSIIQMNSSRRKAGAIQLRWLGAFWSKRG